MPRLTERQIIEELLNRYDAAIREAFLDSIADIRDDVVLRELAEWLERGDIEGALRALHLDPEAFYRLDRAIRIAYDEAGQLTTENLPRAVDGFGNRVVFRWGVRNIEAEQWLNNHSATLVTNIIDDQRSAIRTALSEGLSRGDNPRQTALDIVGRVSRASNRREGGIIGLTGQQERFVANARRELLSGDEESLRAYLTRGRRDRRFDRTIEKAIRDGRALDRDAVTRIVGRYSDRLLQLRGEMLARTETLRSMGQGRHDAVAQQIRAGKIDVRDVTKIWHSVGDDRVRHSHRALNGKKQEFEAAFVSPSGARLRYPGDPDAPASETIGCRCWCEFKIDFAARLVRQRQAA